MEQKSPFMNAMTSIDDLLDEAEEITGSGDFPQWWEPESQGDELQGKVIDMREDPWGGPDGEPRGYIYHVDTGDEVFATRIHSILIRLMERAEVSTGDLVRITYQGTVETDNGQNANDYTLRHVAQETTARSSGGTQEAMPEASPASPAEAGEQLADPAELEEEEEPEEEELDVPDPSDHTVAEMEEIISNVEDPAVLDEIRVAEEDGADRKSLHGLIDSREEEIVSEAAEDDSPFAEAVEFAESLVEFHGDDLTADELDKYLNTVRGFDVDTDDVITELGVDLD